MYYVYRFLDSNNNIIYVGRTNNLKLRMYQHFTNGHLGYEVYNSVYAIDYLEFDSKVDHHVAEIFLINKYQPVFNTKDKIEGDMSVKLNIEEDYKIYKVLKGGNSGMYLNENGMVVIDNATPVYHYGEIEYYNVVVSLREIAQVYPLLTYDGDAQRGMVDGKPVVINSHIKGIKETIKDGGSIRGNLTWNVRDNNDESIIALDGENEVQITGEITVPDSWHRHCAIREVYEEDPEHEALNNEMVLNIYNLTKESEVALFVDINGKGRAPNNNRVKYLADTPTSRFVRDLIDESNLKDRVECVKSSSQGDKITKFSTLYDALFGSIGIYKNFDLENNDKYNELLEYLTEFIDVLLDSRDEFSFSTPEEKREYKSQTMVLEEISWWSYFKIAKRFTERGITDWKLALKSRMQHKTRTAMGNKVDFWSKDNPGFTPVLKWGYNPMTKEAVCTGGCVNSNTTRRSMQVIVDVHLFNGVFG